LAQRAAEATAKDVRVCRFQLGYGLLLHIVAHHQQQKQQQLLKQHLMQQRSTVT